jgi:hypothetical protein
LFSYQTAEILQLFHILPHYLSSQNIEKEKEGMAEEGKGGNEE